MPDSITIRVVDGDQQCRYTGSLVGPLELGRQTQDEPLPFSPVQSGRLVIAPLSATNLSRQQLLIEPTSDAAVRLSNLSSHTPVVLKFGRVVAPRNQITLPLPTSFRVADITIELGPLPADDPLASLIRPTLAPARSLEQWRAQLPSRSLAVSPDSAGLGGDSLVGWLHSAMGVWQCSAGDPDFYRRAAEAVVAVVGLDRGRALLWREGQFATVAEYPPSEESHPLSQRILERVRLDKRTYWLTPDLTRDASLQGANAVVAAPILDRDGNVLGALYADRRGTGGVCAISTLDATLIEFLASGVAAGLERLEREQAAIAARVQFEQFFTPQLARYLEADPQLLAGRDAEVTILFADIRRFSRLSEKIGPRQTVTLIHDAMNLLSECVLEHSGVVVDYIGDELLAMWGAPADDDQHATRACHAALQMLARWPELQAQWEPLLEESLEIGIGINTGSAQVGNVGSRTKFKYGPLGNSVNVASRVQGATKYLQVPLVITGATRAHLATNFDLRRLSQVRVVNVTEPVHLYELRSPASHHSSPAPWTVRYEEALTAFELGRTQVAASLLAELLAQHPQDGPSLTLMTRVQAQLDEPQSPFDPVWELPGK
jgi:adenylate cyclase